MAIDRPSVPRPKGDTALALRLGTIPEARGPESTTKWQDDVKRSGATWVVVPATLDASPGEGIIRGLVSRGLEVVVEIGAIPIEPLDLDRLRQRCRELTLWGARYVALYRHPNLASSWRMTDWAPAGVVERFGQALVPALETISLSGLYPIVGALAPGGHYWDLVFLDRLLVYLVQRGREPLLERLVIGFDWPATNRPINWGKGGPAAWPKARPYTCPTGSQDHRGFYVFEWYDAVIRARVGRSLPQLGLASGACPTTVDHPDLPPLDDLARRAQILEAARLASNGGIPDYVLAVGGWPYTPGAATSIEALYSLLSDENGAAVDVLRRMVSHPRPAAMSSTTRGEEMHANLSEEPAAGPRSEPIIDHYVLIDVAEDGSAPLGWTATTALVASLDFIRRCRPTVGFRIDEARRAARVTLIGPSIEALESRATELRDAGGNVDLIAAPTTGELKRALERLWVADHQPLGAAP